MVVTAPVVAVSLALAAVLLLLSGTSILRIASSVLLLALKACSLPLRVLAPSGILLLTEVATSSLGLVALVVVVSSFHD